MIDIKSKKSQKANHKKQNGGDIQTGMREFIVKVLKKGCKFLGDRNYDNGTREDEQLSDVFEVYQNDTRLDIYPSTENFVGVSTTRRGFKITNNSDSASKKI